MAIAKPYTFEQSDSDVKVLLPLDAAIKAKDVNFALTPTALTLGIKGQARTACAARVLAAAPLARSTAQRD
jgi:hypothetical protein